MSKSPPSCTTHEELDNRPTKDGISSLGLIGHDQVRLWSHCDGECRAEPFHQIERQGASRRPTSIIGRTADGEPHVQGRCLPTSDGNLELPTNGPTRIERGLQPEAGT